MLDRLLRDIRSSRSRVLVLRGEAGVGKTVLLDYLTGQVPASRERAGGRELRELPGAGHALTVSQPDAVAELILDAVVCLTK